jgi:hypothetical protein
MENPIELVENARKCAKRIGEVLKNFQNKASMRVFL